MTETDEPIDAEWLKSVGIHQHDSTEPEFHCRIVGGSDDGWKHSSDDDAQEDEIAELVVCPLEDGSAACYIETWQLPDMNTTALIDLGVRKTRSEVLDLCRALKAWSVSFYP